MLTVVVTPAIASSKLRCRSDSMSWPRRGPVVAGPWGPASTSAEQVPDQVRDVAALETDTTRAAEPAGAEPAAGPGRSARPEPAGHRTHPSGLVVLGALLGVADHLVRSRDVLEARLGGRVTGVRVRVQLPGERPVGARDLLLGGRLGDPEDGVVVLLEPLTLHVDLLSDARWPGPRCASSSPSGRPTPAGQPCSLIPVPSPSPDAAPGRSRGTPCAARRRRPPRLRRPPRA